MMRLSLAVCALLFAFHGQAMAAGFDCKAAKSAIETMICQDQALSAKDSKLNELYKSIRARLSPSGKTILLHEERYNVSLMKECFAKNMGDTAAKRRECLSGWYDANIQRLNDAVKFPPYIILTDGFHDQHKEDDGSVTTMDASWSVIDGFVDDKILKTNDIIDQECRPDPDWANDGHYDNTTNNCTVTYINSQLYSIHTAVFHYPEDGTPAEYNEEFQTHLLGAGAVPGANDAIDDSEIFLDLGKWRSVVTDACDGGEGFDVPSVEDSAFTVDGLTVQCGEKPSANTNAPTADIPWSDLQAFLKQGIAPPASESK